MNKLVIKIRIISLNEYINLCRSNKYLANNYKQEVEHFICTQIKLQKIKKIEKFPTKIIINWYESNKKRDIDNITFGVKFILDSLVKVGILPNDSQKYVNKIESNVFVDRTNPRIEVDFI